MLVCDVADGGGDPLRSAVEGLGGGDERSDAGPGAVRTDHQVDCCGAGAGAGAECEVDLRRAGGRAVVSAAHGAAFVVPSDHVRGASSGGADP